jgi:hypothetical protein
VKYLQTSFAVHLFRISTTDRSVLQDETTQGLLGLCEVLVLKKMDRFPFPEFSCCAVSVYAINTKTSDY